jgi:hypothetical protein
MGLSLAEVNAMSMQDFMDFAAMWASDGDEDGVVPATQADIKRFMG